MLEQVADKRQERPDREVPEKARRRSFSAQARGHDWAWLWTAGGIQPCLDSWWNTAMTVPRDTPAPMSMPDDPPETATDDDKPTRLIQRSAAAAVGAVIAQRLAPGGALIGAAAGPYLEVLARRVWDEVSSDARHRQAEVLGVAARATDQGPEEFAATACETEQKRLLAATAMTGAARTAWPSKVYALGQALADGLIADPDQVNIADLALPAMIDIERPHLSVLELLTRWVPNQEDESNHARRYKDNSRDQFMAYGFDAGDFTVNGWAAGKRIWTTGLIETVRPSLQPVLTSLIGTLQRHGLIVQRDNTATVLANYSEALRKEMSENGVKAGQRITADAFKLPQMSEMAMRGIAPRPSWSPTELGERILGYYDEAALEFDAREASPSVGAR
jgi:hypothetical protein